MCLFDFNLLFSFLTIEKHKSTHHHILKNSCLVFSFLSFLAWVISIFSHFFSSLRTLIRWAFFMPLPLFVDMYLWKNSWKYKCWVHLEFCWALLARKGCVHSRKLSWASVNLPLEEDRFPVPHHCAAPVCCVHSSDGTLLLSCWTGINQR